MWRIMALWSFPWNQKISAWSIIFCNSIVEPWFWLQNSSLSPVEAQTELWQLSSAPKQWIKSPYTQSHLLSEKQNWDKMLLGTTCNIYLKSWQYVKRKSGLCIFKNHSGLFWEHSQCYIYKLHSHSNPEKELIISRKSPYQWGRLEYIAV